MDAIETSYEKELKLKSDGSESIKNEARGLYSMPGPQLLLLLIFLPIALLAHLAGSSEVLIFAASALAIIPLAKLLGEATEVMADKSGPRIGDLLNAIFGNAAELIITLSAIRAGQFSLSWLR